MLTIYTTGPECYKCNLTKGRFEKAGVAFTEVLLSDAPDAAAGFRDQGHTSAPVVTDELTNTMWSDFRPDRIRAALVARGVNP